MKNLLAVLAVLATANASSADPLTDSRNFPFDGTTLANWTAKEKDKGENRWIIGEPSLSAENPGKFEVKEGLGKEMAMVNLVGGHGEGWDIFSSQEWGSCRIELEFMVAKGANSGVYVMGEYELQILDSYGKETMGDGDMGAIYGAKPASVNACLKPGEWQKLVILFRAPTFDADGKKTADARFLRVTLNGQEIQKDIEMKGPTPSGVTGKEKARGPLMFQGDHGAVAFRKIRIIPLEVGTTEGTGTASPDALRKKAAERPGTR